MKRHPVLIEHAKNLRQDQPFAETRLWEVLRGGKLGKFKFRRQHDVEPYVVDFCCPKVKVIVELDGDAHVGRKSQDQARGGYLTRLGYEIVRFENCDIRNKENRVIERILDVCKRRAAMETESLRMSPLTPNPSPPRGEGS
jgi:very-short-patch-repair endonuclease